MPQGSVTKLKHDRGFGFIRPDEGGEEVFFHRSSVNEDGYDRLQEGQAVTYEMESSPRGPRASNVTPA